MMAVILAAGVGARLRPLTDDRPKAMLAVAGEPLLHRMMRQLRAVGVEEFVVATGHAPESVAVDAIRCFNPHYATTQNVVSLHACATHLSGEVWKLDGDLFVEDEVIARLARAPLRDDEMLCAVSRRSDLGDEEMKVALNGDRIVRFGKRIAGHAESAGIERIGSYALSTVLHAVGAAVTGGETDLYYEDVYDRVLSRITARAVEVGDLKWTEIDTPEDLQRAEHLSRALDAGR
jgi:choline kinase